MTVQTAKKDFEALAAGAEACARDMQDSFVLYLWEHGRWVGDDSFADMDTAANALVDGFEDWGLSNQMVLEIDIHGNAHDVTDEARKAVEEWCDARGECAPWEYITEYDQADADHARLERHGWEQV